MRAPIPAVLAVLSACGSASPPRPAKLANTATPPVERVLDPAVHCTAGSSCTIAWHDGDSAYRATHAGRAIAIDVDGVRQADALHVDEDVIGLDVADVDVDGRPDLVVWIDPHTGPHDEVERDTVVFVAASDGPGTFKLDEWSSVALGVVPDSATLHREAAGLRSFAMPDDTMPTQQLLLRLTFATAGELVAVIAPDGLDSCLTRPGSARRCRHYRRDELTETALFDLIARVGPGQTPHYVGVHSCTTSATGTTITCVTGDVGPATLTYTFHGTGSARRLAEIDADVHSNS